MHFMLFLLSSVTFHIALLSLDLINVVYLIALLSLPGQRDAAHFYVVLFVCVEAFSVNS